MARTDSAVITTRGIDDPAVVKQIQIIKERLELMEKGRGSDKDIVVRRGDLEKLGFNSRVLDFSLPTFQHELHTVPSRYRMDLNLYTRVIRHPTEGLQAYRYCNRRQEWLGEERVLGFTYPGALAGDAYFDFGNLTLNANRGPLFDHEIMITGMSCRSEVGGVTGVVYVRRSGVNTDASLVFDNQQEREDMTLKASFALNGKMQVWWDFDTLGDDLVCLVYFKRRLAI